MSEEGIKLIFDFWILNRSFVFDENKLGIFIHEEKLDTIVYIFIKYIQ